MAKITISCKDTSEVKFRKLLSETMNTETIDNSINLLRERLKSFEDKYGMTSQEFYEKVNRCETEESEDFFNWYGDYIAYCDLTQVKESKEEAKM